MRALAAVLLMAAAQFSASIAFGQNMSGVRSGFNGGIGGGPVLYSPSSTSSQVKLDNPGWGISAQEEMGIEFWGGFNLNVGLNYRKTTGSLNYDYTVGLHHFLANQVNVTFDDLHANVGFRYKLFKEFPVRPYFEVGGLAGYFQLTYDGSLKTPAVLAVGDDYKTVEGVVGFGYYGELGLEYLTMPAWGIRLSYQHCNTGTAPFDTLGKSSLRYGTDSYTGSLFWWL